MRKVPETGKSRALRFLRNCLWWMTRLGCDCLWLSVLVECCIFQLSTWIRPLSVWAFTASTQLCRRNPLLHGLRRRRHSAAMEGNELEVTLKVHNLCEAALLARRPSRTSYESRRPPPSRDLPKVLVDEDSTNLKVWNHGLSVFHKCRLSLTAKMVGSWQAAWPVHARRPAQTQQNPKSALWILWAFGAWLRLGFECLWLKVSVKPLPSVARKLCWRAWAAMKLLASYRSAQIWTWNWLWYDVLSRFEQTLWHSSDERPNAVTASLEESRGAQNAPERSENILKWSEMLSSELETRRLVLGIGKEDWWWLQTASSFSPVLRALSCTTLLPVNSAPEKVRLHRRASSQI